MYFYIDKEQCKLEQSEILEFWKNNKYFSNALELTEKIFLGDEAFNIYENFSDREDIYNIEKSDNYKNDILKFLNNYFDINEIVYILFAGNYPEKYRFGLSEQSYPIFEIEYKHISLWIDLIEDDNFQTIFISDLKFNKVIEISNIIDCNQSFETYTVSVKLSKF